MKFIGSLFGISSPKPAPQPAPLPTVTRDDAQDQLDQQQALLRRRGGAADVLTGSFGAPAPAGAKTTLGS